jgi:hypothetical protein
MSIDGVEQATVPGQPGVHLISARRALCALIA